MALSGYRIATGTLTIATLTDTYAIESLPLQSDMGTNNLWIPPQGDTLHILPEVVESTLDGHQTNEGGETLVWELPIVTSDMIAYLKATTFSGDPSATMTIRTWDFDTAAFRVLVGIARWPPPDVINSLTRVYNGYENFPIRFIKCQTAAAS